MLEHFALGASVQVKLSFAMQPSQMDIDLRISCSTSNTAFNYKAVT